MLLTHPFTYKSMVRAQDDFYQSVNEEWLAANPCPSDYSRWGTFEELNKVSLLFVYIYSMNMIKFGTLR